MDNNAPNSLSANIPTANTVTPSTATNHIPSPIPQQNITQLSNTPTESSVSNVQPTNQTQQINTNPYIDTSKISCWDETQQIISKLEQTFNGKVIVLYIPYGARLVDDDTKEIYNHIEKIGKADKINVVIYGPGGSGIAAYKIVKLIRSYFENFTIVAPNVAASAMTMLTLGADQILTGPLTSFSPIDTSITNHPLAPIDQNKRPVAVEIQQVQKYLEMAQSEKFGQSGDFSQSVFATLSEKVHPLLLGTIQRSLSLSKLLTRSILKTHMTDDDKITKIVNTLNDQYPIHSYPIMKEDFLELGLNVQEMTKEQNYLTIDLFSYYDLLSKTIRKNGKEKSTTVRQNFIESNGFRGYYWSQIDREYVDGKWIEIGSADGYTRAVMVKNKKGFFEVAPLSTKDFRKWMKNEDFEIE